MVSGPYKGLWIPFLVGANSTPPTMLMSPMWPLYPRDVQDVMLAEHAYRAYPDFVFDPEPWNAAENGRTFSDADIVAVIEYLRAKHFRPVAWRGDFRKGVDARLRAMVDAGLGYYGHGEEVDNDANHPGVTSSEYERSLETVVDFIAGRIPIACHFTADDRRQMGWPIGGPRYDYMKDWRRFNGLVHLWQQLNVDASAGLQGASMWYARRAINCGIGDVVAEPAKGNNAPKSRVVAFETSAYAALYGRMTELDGVRRSWEVFCGTRDDARALPVAGSGNGLWRPDGSRLLVGSAA